MGDGPARLLSVRACFLHSVLTGGGRVSRFFCTFFEWFAELFCIYSSRSTLCYVPYKPKSHAMHSQASFLFFF